jgi:hypothetical protein
MARPPLLYWGETGRYAWVHIHLWDGALAPGKSTQEVCNGKVFLGLSPDERCNKKLHAFNFHVNIRAC